MEKLVDGNKIETIEEVKSIICKGKNKCFSESEWNWAIKKLQQLFNSGYDIVRPNNANNEIN